MDKGMILSLILLISKVGESNPRKRKKRKKAWI
jgi:hypothetical protein